MLVAAGQVCLKLQGGRGGGGERRVRYFFPHLNFSMDCTMLGRRTCQAMQVFYSNRPQQKKTTYFNLLQGQENEKERERERESERKTALFTMPSGERKRAQRDWCWRRQIYFLS
jgi:hypothetical protein